MSLAKKPFGTFLSQSNLRCARTLHAQYKPIAETLLLGSGVF